MAAEMRWIVPSSTVGLGDCDIARLGAGAARGANAFSSCCAPAGVAMSTAGRSAIRAFCIGSPSRSMTQTAWIWRYLDGLAVPQAATRGLVRTADRLAWFYGIMRRGIAGTG